MSELPTDANREMGKIFERACADWFFEKGYIVFHHGLTANINDKGIDLIAFKKEQETNIISLIQCKWNSKQNSVAKEVYDKMIDGLKFLLGGGLLYDKRNTKIELVIAATYGAVDKEKFTKPFIEFSHDKDKNPDGIVTGMIFFTNENGSSKCKYKDHYPKKTILAFIMSQKTNVVYFALIFILYLVFCIYQTSLWQCFYFVSFAFATHFCFRKKSLRSPLARS